MPHRFYAPEAARGSGAIMLPGEEADHLRRVLRLRVDDEVRVFDGEGHEFSARVAAIDREGVRVALGEPVEPARELPTHITLAQSALKGDKMDDVVRDAVMLGAHAIQPLISLRADLPASAAAARVGRWTRIAIASTKQCGRARLTRIHPPCMLDAWLRAPGGSLPLMLVEPAIVGAKPLRDVLTSPPESASVLVGPEGGWTPEEIELAVAAGRTLVTLGGRTLRADAVALVVLANLQFAWEVEF
jgi:16S rRNA (uracil1498-N3)-methyltransferase